ncbi:hypothetical protein Tco_1473343 [Tanacetum coccineum]
MRDLLGSRAAGIRQRDALPSLIHETEMPKICLPIRKRPCRTTPGPGYEVGESLVAGTARRVGPTTARADLYGFADMLDAAPGRQTSRELGYGITIPEMNLTGALPRARVQHVYMGRGGIGNSIDALPYHDGGGGQIMAAAFEIAGVQAEIEVLRRERLAYEQESMETRQALARSKAHCRALEARVIVLETEVHRHEWQRQAADDLAVQHIMRTQALEAGARVDTLEDIGSSS